MRRRDDANRGTIEPGASPALDRGEEALDRRGGVCTWSSVCEVARRADVVPNLIYRWRLELRSTAAEFAQVPAQPLRSGVAIQQRRS
jgi:transposase-like protein